MLRLASAPILHTRTLCLWVGHHLLQYKSACIKAGIYLYGQVMASPDARFTAAQ